MVLLEIIQDIATKDAKCCPSGMTAIYVQLAVEDHIGIFMGSLLDLLPSIVTSRNMVADFEPGQTIDYLWIKQNGRRKTSSQCHKEIELYLIWPISGSSISGGAMKTNSHWSDSVQTKSWIDKMTYWYAVLYVWYYFAISCKRESVICLVDTKKCIQSRCSAVVW